MFIRLLFVEGPGRQFYLFVVVTVVISIVLHELAHGWMAIRCGDDTPIHAGHMTGNPLVHMGPFALVALVLCGIAWGQMPIDPTRMRGKYAQAWVAVAGPATNLILAVVGLTCLGLWNRFDSGSLSQVAQNGKNFLFAFGQMNLLLCVFNLMPLPPLDGSHILANLHRPYALFMSDPAKQQWLIFGFIFVFFISGRVFFPLASNVAEFWVTLITS